MPIFLKRNKKSELLETILSEENKRKSVIDVNGSFDPSRITECARRILYRSIGTPQCYNVSHIDKESNKANIKKWVDILDGCIRINILDRDIVTADSKYNITYNVHALISFDDGVYITQINPVSSNDFDKILKTGAFKKDVVEITICLWLLELTDGLLLYANNEDNNYIVFHVEPYKPIITAIKSKCDMMIRHKINGTLPERPYKDDSSDECRSCEFKNKCWS